jgi:hypothetical protein
VGNKKTRPLLEPGFGKAWAEAAQAFPRADSVVRRVGLRFPGQVSWLMDHYGPGPFPFLMEQWIVAGPLPNYSGATAAVSHRLPS